MIRLQPEQILILLCRAVPGKCRVVVSVKAGRPTSVRCRGSHIEQPTMVEGVSPDLSIFESECTATERYLLNLGKEIWYGEIPVDIENGRIAKIHEEDVTWTRLMQEQEIPKAKTREFIQFLIARSPGAS